MHNTINIRIFVAHKYKEMGQMTEKTLALFTKYAANRTKITSPIVGDVVKIGDTIMHLTVRHPDKFQVDEKKGSLYLCPNGQASHSGGCGMDKVKTAHLVPTKFRRLVSMWIPQDGILKADCAVYMNIGVRVWKIEYKGNIISNMDDFVSYQKKEGIY